MTYTIRYRRPDAPWSVVVMVVPSGVDNATAQMSRLRTLGYSIVDVSPPLPETTPANVAAHPLDEAS